MIYDMEVPTKMTSMNRARVIDSLCAMFNKVHNNSTTPEWLMELHISSSDEILARRMANWMKNYPEAYSEYGVYVM